MSKTYGIKFPFLQSEEGLFFKMTNTPQEEIKSNLVHLILTRKGTRFFLPDFGTRIYQFLFEPNDTLTWSLIEDDIRESVKKYIPNLQIDAINFTQLERNEFNPHLVKLEINYRITSGSFETSEFVIINI